MSVTSTPARLASPADLATFGPYRNPQAADDPRPLYRFTGRLSADGSSDFRAEPGRYHLYASWTCPWSQRVVLELAVNGLTDVVGISYVDDVRDGRGWAFRESDGPDPVNGFALLREAYEATEPGFDGLVNVPVLWDTRTRRIVSNDYATLGLDVATQFPGLRRPGIDTYPVEHRAEIDELDAWIGPAVNHGLGTASADSATGRAARDALLAAFDRLDHRLADGGFLVGHRITEADIRLWVSLARYDVQANWQAGRGGRLGPPLTAWRHLAWYAAWLAGMPAFTQSTRWSSVSAGPGAQPLFLSAHPVPTHRHPRSAR